MRRTGNWVLGGIALILTILATAMIARADSGLHRTTTTVDSVPVTTLALDDDTVRPAIVVVHGFAGSSQIMDALAVSLARAGYRVFLPDLHGHGSNTTPYAIGSDGKGRQADLVADVDTVTRWAARQPGVAPGGIGLVGHSMGAGAVVAYGVQDARGPRLVRATVALSLPSAADVPPGEPAVPRNLLLMWGAAEPPAFSAAGTAALQAAYPSGAVGQAYGSADEGTARATRVIPGVDHIGIVFSAAAAQAAVDWLDASVAVGSPGHVVEPDARILWLLVLLLGAVIGFIPLARLAFGTPTGREPSVGAPVIPGAWALAIAVASALVSVIACRPLVGRSPLLPLSVADYAVAWFAIAGALAGLGAWWTGRHRSRRPMTDEAQGSAGLGRAVVATLALTAYLIAALALASQRTWSDFALVGPRAWVLPAVEVAFLIYFWSDERLVSRQSRGRRACLVVANRVVLVAALVVAAQMGWAPGVLTLWVPLLGILLVVLGACAAVVAGRTPERWAVAVVQAIPLAYVVATSFPVVG